MDKDKPVLELMGKDGNAFYILGAAKQVAVKNNMEPTEGYATNW